MADTVTIAQRFHGPPQSGNGGYVCGLVARAIAGGAEVTLKAPPPLETPLNIAREGEAAILRHGGAAIAIARPAAPASTPPPAPGAAEAAAAAARYRGHQRHVFPTCFVCGPQSADGLALFAGPVEGRDLVACPWTPGADLADSDGAVASEYLWAALDCPSYWALPEAGSLAAVLGRLTAVIEARPRAGAPLIVAAWPLGVEGRKHFSAAALYSSDGRVLARADAVWIALKDQAA